MSIGKDAAKIELTYPKIMNNSNFSVNIRLSGTLTYQLSVVTIFIPYKFLQKTPKLSFQDLELIFEKITEFWYEK